MANIPPDPRRAMTGPYKVQRWGLHGITTLMGTFVRKDDAMAVFDRAKQNRKAGEIVRLSDRAGVITEIGDASQIPVVPRKSD